MWNYHLKGEQNPTKNVRVWVKRGLKMILMLHYQHGDITVLLIG